MNIVTYAKSLKRTEFKQNQKLEKPKNEYLATGIDPEKVIFNYSSYTLDKLEKKVLSSGLKFSLYPNKLDYCSFLTPFEKLACSLKNRPIQNERVNFDYVKTKLKSIALSSFYGFDVHQMPLNISKAEIVALKKLCRNKDIIITRPDKGNGIVILNRADYINKVLAILDDTSKFSQLDTDILELCQKRENKLVRLLRDNLLKKKYITEEVYRESFPSGMDYQGFINLTVLLGLSFLLLVHIIIS